MSQGHHALAGLFSAMQFLAKPSSADDILALRTRHRQEMNCQIVHDSIHRREGWTLSYLLERAGVPVGFGSVAIGGPWKDKPTLLEFYLTPEHRNKAFCLFETFLESSGARFFEAQTNDVLLTSMALTYGKDLAVEKIVFHDGLTTTHVRVGGTLRQVIPDEEIRTALERRQGGGEWLLELDGAPAGKGGLLFHYNRPYGDLYMEVSEPFRRRGLGAYLVQELKRISYDLGAVPCARCNPGNLASRLTLQSAGFVPCAQIIVGSIGAPAAR